MPIYDPTADINILHGDCRVLMKLIPDGAVDAVVTDPPYFQESDIKISHDGVAKRFEESNTIGMPWGYSLDWVEIVAELNPAHWVVFCNYLMLGDIHRALSNYANIGSVFVWRKSNAPQMVRPVPRLDCEFIIWAKRDNVSCGRMNEFKSQVIDIPMLQAGCMKGERVLQKGSGKALHPCQKPRAVVQPFIDRLFDGPGKTILDPFVGSGTTLVAAMKAGHRAIGIESDARYLPIIERRVAEARTPLFDGIT